MMIMFASLAILLALSLAASAQRAAPSARPRMAAVPARDTGA